MGRRFMKASIRLRKAVVSQNVSQSHVAGKMLPIVMKLPTLFAPSAVNKYFKSLTYPESTSIPWEIPAGILAQKP